MTNRKDLLSLGFYKKSCYTGSDGEMRYRIEKTTENDEDQLLVTVWRGPYAFATTTEEKTTHLLPFSDAGIDEAVVWLNSMSPSFNPDR